MLVSDFYKALARVRNKFTWLVDDSGNIRAYTNDAEEFCPITAVCATKTKQYFEPNQYSSAAKVLHLRDRDAVRIASAADDESYNKTVRSKLLSALKLMSD
jgi:hypothetical protein